jgi:hypothetical protein
MRAFIQSIFQNGFGIGFDRLLKSVAVELVERKHRALAFVQDHFPDFVLQVVAFRG